MHTWIDVVLAIIATVIAPLINLFVYWRVQKMHDCLDAYHEANLRRFDQILWRGNNESRQSDRDS